ncbi:MAG TPA: ankyrin repeat domain-containing protein [Burkholderiaceae bacterium]|nr:ankyrin repeat domain-containing protein [Burkholderiaceae bacterium]
MRSIIGRCFGLAPSPQATVAQATVRQTNQPPSGGAVQAHAAPRDQQLLQSLRELGLSLNEDAAARMHVSSEAAANIQALVQFLSTHPSRPDFHAAFDALFVEGTHRRAFFGVTTLMRTGVLDVPVHDPNSVEGEQWIHHIARVGREFSDQTQIAGTEPISLGERFKRLADCNISLNTRSKTGVSPLIAALEHGNQDAALALIQQGARVNIRRADKATPLHLAAEKGALAAVIALIKKKASVHAENSMRDRPLHRAAENGHLHVVNALLDHQADIDSFNAGHRTALHTAVEASDLNMVRTLLRRGASTAISDMDAQQPLHIAVALNHAAIAHALLEHGADPNKLSGTEAPLVMATREGHRDVIALLLEHKADVHDSFGFPMALRVAIEKGSRDIVERLLNHGVSINKRDHWDGYTALHCAADVGNVEFAQLLLDRGADPSLLCKKGRTPAALARRFGHDAMAAKLQSAAPV